MSRSCEFPPAPRSFRFLSLPSSVPLLSCTILPLLLLPLPLSPQSVSRPCPPEHHPTLNPHPHRLVPPRTNPNTTRQPPGPCRLARDRPRAARKRGRPAPDPPHATLQSSQVCHTRPSSGPTSWHPVSSRPLFSSLSSLSRRCFAQRRAACALCVPAALFFLREQQC